MLNVKALVGPFNQEKALVRGLLRDYEPLDGPSVQALPGTGTVTRPPSGRGTWAGGWSSTGRSSITSL